MPNILLPMDMHNVLRECDYDLRDNPRYARAKVADFMRPLIDALTVKRPHWTFVVMGSYGGTQVENDYHYNRFVVMVGDEELGWIGRAVNWRTGVQSYEFNSRFLDRKRARGSSTSTKDLKKATKMILENFSELSYDEHIFATEKVVSSLLANQHSRTMYRNRNAIERVGMDMIAYLLPQWERFVSSLPPEIVADAMALPELVQAAGEAQRMYEMHKAKTSGAYVRTLGDKYVVKRLKTNDTCVYTQATLPDDLRGPLGALKLVADETLIDGIGARAGNGAFYVVTGDGDVQQS